MSAVAMALLMADTGYLKTSKPNGAVLLGTLVGFIMISIIIIISTVIDSPLHTLMVCNKFLFWHSFALQHIVYTRLSLATEHTSDNMSSSSSSALQLFVSFGLLNYFFPFLPLLRLLFPIVHSHLPQIIPHIIFPSYSWPSLRSCCIRFPFVYGLAQSFIGNSFYMPQPAQSFVFYISYYWYYVTYLIVCKHNYR